MDAIQTLKNILEKEMIPSTKEVFKRGEFLKLPETINHNLYFVLSGSLRVYFIDDCEEHILYFGYKKSLVTAIDSFFSKKKSSLYVQALKKTEVLKISKQNLMSFLKSNPRYFDLYFHIMEELIQLRIEKEKILLISSPINRYKRLLHQMPELFQEIPNKYIASYLRMSPETFSRIKNLDLNQDLLI